MSANDVIARLRAQIELIPRDSYRVVELLEAIPALLECAEAVRGVEQLLGEYIDKNGTVDVKIALAFETARAALQALAEGGGE
jgi:hypothetical protein